MWTLRLCHKKASLNLFIQLLVYWLHINIRHFSFSFKFHEALEVKSSLWLQVVSTQIETQHRIPKANSINTGTSFWTNSHIRGHRNKGRQMVKSNCPCVSPHFLESCLRSSYSRFTMSLVACWLQRGNLQQDIARMSWHILMWRANQEGCMQQIVKSQIDTAL